MQLYNGRVLYSATDLNNFLACGYLTSQDRDVVRSGMPRPKRPEDQTAILARLGDQHEARYLERLRAQGRDVAEIDRDAPLEDAVAATIAAMRAGREIVYQAAFLDGDWMGRADFLRRVPNAPGTAGAAFGWHYEVEDAKLARHTEPYFLLQLCYYSEHAARITGVVPERVHVVLGDGSTHAFRHGDFSAYYRHVRRSFEAALASGEEPYPLPVAHCSLCVWSESCEQRWKRDDHLEQVAGITALQTQRLNRAGIATLAALGTASPGLRVEKMERATFEKLHRQARLQLAQRRADAAGEPPIPPEFLPHDAQTWQTVGFALLPPPSEHDAFFDMEGDPYYDLDASLEYLFGVHTLDDGYRAFWGCNRNGPGSDRRAEKLAFEQFVDYVMERYRRHPEMHVYHYASYEKTKLQELSGRHATREDEVDTILRDGLLVDLYRVVRQSIAIGQPSYSIKKLELYYGLRGEETSIKSGGDSVVQFEQWLAGRFDPAFGNDGILEDLETYNRYDCESTYQLREWLLGLRERLRAERGIEIPFFQGAREEQKLPPPDKYAELKERLQAQIPAGFDFEEREPRFEAARPLWQTLQMLDYHWREDKPVYWAFHNRCEAYQEDRDALLDDGESLTGLEFLERIDEGGRSKSYLARYRFPLQEFKLGNGPCFAPQHKGEVGKIVEIEMGEDEGVVTIRREPRHQQRELADAIVARKIVPAPHVRAALARFAESLLDGGARAYRAAFDILTRAVPRRKLAGGGELQPRTPDVASIGTVLGDLDESYLFIQGPPGSGKTYAAARLIANLLAQHERVGIAAHSHKAIHNLLAEVERVVHERRHTFEGVKAASEDEPEKCFDSRHGFIENVKAFDDRPRAQLYAGTVYAFCRSQTLGEKPVDYLFIDEAGQVALPNAIAASTMARNVVLLGDPLQLAQVTHTSHPGGIGRSVLLHLLGEEVRPVAPDRGILLTESYRMNAPVCAFVSDTMYEGRLRPAPGRERQRVDSPGLGGQGLRFIGVEHDGNRQSSFEEAAVIAREAELLLRGTVTEHDGTVRALEPRDIVIVTPYNAQVRCIARALRKAGGDCARIEAGTVDKFQGREAHVVFFSTAASTPEDAPRGIGFIFDRNRFNVAVSRARSLAVLVASPELLAAPCRTVDHAQAMNGVLSFRERCPEATDRGAPITPGCARD